MIDLKEVFERLSETDYIKFDRVKNPLSSRPDLCAFLFLDKLVAGTGDIVACSEHDEIWLNVDVDELARLATEEDILTLVRCGVRYDSSVQSLVMYT